jgi:hypothetical protein
MATSTKIMMIILKSAGIGTAIENHNRENNM